MFIKSDAMSNCPTNSHALIKRIKIARLNFVILVIGIIAMMCVMPSYAVTLDNHPATSMPTGPINIVQKSDAKLTFKEEQMFTEIKMDAPAYKIVGFEDNTQFFYCQDINGTCYKLDLINETRKIIDKLPDNLEECGYIQTDPGEEISFDEGKEPTSQGEKSGYSHFICNVNGTGYYYHNSVDENQKNTTSLLTNKGEVLAKDIADTALEADYCTLFEKHLIAFGDTLCNLNGEILGTNIYGVGKHTKVCNNGLVYVESAKVFLDMDGKQIDCNLTDLKDMMTIGAYFPHDYLASGYMYFLSNEGFFKVTVTNQAKPKISYSKNNEVPYKNASVSKSAEPIPDVAPTGDYIAPAADPAAIINTNIGTENNATTKKQIASTRSIGIIVSVVALAVVAVSIGIFVLVLTLKHHKVKLSESINQ